MKYINIVIVTTAIFVGCNNAPSSEQSEIAKDTAYDMSSDKNEVVVNNEITQDVSRPDFLNDSCLEFWVGGIQRVEASSILVLGECFKGQNSYDMLAIPKGNIKNEIGSSLLNAFKRSKNDVTAFKVYALLLPKKMQEEPENEFDKYDYIFPSEVKVYERNEQGEWIKLQDRKINSINELNSLKKELSEM